MSDVVLFLFLFLLCMSDVVLFCLLCMSDALFLFCLLCPVYSYKIIINVLCIM